MVAQQKPILSRRRQPIARLDLVATGGGASGEAPSSRPFAERVGALLARGRVSEARVLVSSWQRTQPDARADELAELLAPSVARATGRATGSMVSASFDWILRHGGEYPGEWVALVGERLVAHDQDRAQLMHRLHSQTWDDLPMVVQMARCPRRR